MLLGFFEWLENHPNTIEAIGVLGGGIAATVTGMWVYYRGRTGETANESASGAKADRASIETMIRVLLERSRLREGTDRDDLRHALGALRSQPFGSSAPEGATAALFAAANGHSDLAERIFAEEAAFLERQAQEQLAEANRRAAIAYRHHGSLVSLHDTQKALGAYRKATELDAENPDGWDQLGRLLVRIGKFGDALKVYQQELTSLPSIERDTWRARALNQQGVVYRKQGDLSRAQARAEEALTLSERIGYEPGRAAAYGNLGNVFKNQGLLDKAEGFHKRALELNQRLSLDAGIANDYGNLANIYKKRRKFAEAEKYYKKSLDIERRLGRKEGVAADSGNLAEVFQLRGKFRKAREYYEHAYELNVELDRKEGQAIQLFNLGTLARDMRNIVEAEDLLTRSAVLFEELGITVLAKKARAELDALAQKSA